MLDSSFYCAYFCLPLCIFQGYAFAILFGSDSIEVGLKCEIQIVPIWNYMRIDSVEGVLKIMTPPLRLLLILVTAMKFGFFIRF